jgi:cysteine-rich repeat protein
VVEYCGDGVVNNSGAEQCDDGNASNLDACTNACADAFCGDGFVRTGVEECDDGGNVDLDGCDASCADEYCGDGIVNDNGAEACDDGNSTETDGCLSSCVAASCGDGIVEAGVDECDDGNTVSGDGCSATCVDEYCGDGIVNDNGTEECDDGGNVSLDGCSATCVDEYCGDGIVNDNGTETCDDGDTAGGDGCGPTCQVEVCGDGIVNNAGMEECDDGNTASGDGCTEECLAECSAVPRQDCRAGAVNKLLVRGGAVPEKFIVKWKLLKGAATAVEEISNPNADGAYNLCLYPDAPDLPGEATLAHEALIPSGELWKVFGRGYKYKDVELTTSGMHSVKIIGGDDGRTVISALAKGAGISSQVMPATSYTIQLVDVGSGICWGSTFATGAKSDSLFKGQ